MVIVDDEFFGGAFLGKRMENGVRFGFWVLLILLYAK